MGIMATNGGIHTAPAFKAHNRRCHSLNKAVAHHRYYFVLAHVNILNFCLFIWLKGVMDPFAPKFYSPIQINIDTNIRDGLNFVTCE